MPDRKLIDDPKFWRSRAKKIRTAAEETDDLRGKAIMNRIADDYESLAQYAEQRRRSHND